jgi:hypothetical protein
MFLDVNKELPTADTRCRWVSPRTRWCDCIVASGFEPPQRHGEQRPYTLDYRHHQDHRGCHQVLRVLRAGCNQRRIAWWLNDALNEFPSTEARAATAHALDKAMRIDLLMEQNLDIALAPQGGISLDMNTADETPAREEDAPRAPTTTTSTGNLKSSLLQHGT